MFAYRSILHEPPRPAVIRENPPGHLGSQSSQAGNHGYSGTEQAPPAFVVLAVMAARAAAIALASRAGARASGAAQEGGPGRCGLVRET